MTASECAGPEVGGTLRGRTAIVTGGSQGIDYGVAAALVEAGAAVVITGRTARTFQSGVFATWRYMTAAFPYLRRSGGTVVNFGSGAGVVGMAGHGVYAANKEAIRGLSRVAAREWGADGVTVNVIIPVIRTPQIANLPPRTWTAWIRR